MLICSTSFAGVGFYIGTGFDGDGELMAKRVSHSLLDPFYSQFVPGIYKAMRIPRESPVPGYGCRLAILI